MLVSCGLFFDPRGFTSDDVPDAAATADGAPNDGAGGDDASAGDSATSKDATVSDGGGIIEAGGDAVAYRDEVLADQPIFYLRFEETTGTVANDEVGAASTYEGPVELGVPGPIAGSKAIKLNGNSAVNGGMRAQFTGKAPYTFEGWLKPDVYDSEFRAILSNFQTLGKRNSTTLWVHATQGIGFDRFIENDFTSANVQQNMPSPTAWHHFVGVYDGANLLLYIDAILRNQQPDNRTATAASAAPLWVGRSEIDTPPVLGSIDEVAIYAKALTAERIKAHFEAATK